MTRRTRIKQTMSGKAGIALGIAAMGLCAAGHTEQLAKTGSIAYHTGWKHSADVHSPADKIILGRGNTTGITFNDKGAGPLHLGPANCFEAFSINDGRGKTRGVCAFGDTDGDRIFTEFSGSFGPDGAVGTNDITGGTGKYAGIQGGGAWKCKMSGGNGELQCAQRLDYRLP